MTQQTNGPRPPGTPRAPLPAAPRGLPLTDLDRARRFIEWLGGDARYIFPWKSWAVWEDESWNLDATGRDGAFIMQKAGQFADALLEEADQYPSGPAKDAARALALKAFSRDSRCAMVNDIKSFPEILTQPTDFDANPMLLGVQNGVIDLKTGEFREADRDDMVLKKCSIDYDAKAKRPLFDKFIKQILSDDELRGFVQRSLGYALTGSTREQVLFFFFGNGQNGKTTLIGLAEHVMGDYHWHTNASVFLETGKNDVSKDNDFANLPEKRLVVGAEMQEHAKLAENRVKDLTGGDVIYARKLYCEGFNFKPTHKLFLYGNHQPIIPGTDGGIWRRILLIPFDYKVPENERDFELEDKLRTEAAGVLNWMIEGCLEWNKKGLMVPDSVRNATRRYREDEDIIMQFIEAECVMEGEILSGVLSSNFADWMKGAGYKWSPSPRAIAERLKRVTGISRAKKHGVSVWRGISLKDPAAYRAK